MSFLNMMSKINATSERRKKAINLSIGFLMIGLCCILPLNSFAQTKSISVVANNKPLKEVFHSIEENSQYIFFYVDNTIDLTKRVTINCRNKKIDNVLQELFKETPYIYHISGRQIYVSKRKSAQAAPEHHQQPLSTKRKITGRVTDEKGAPLIGVNVLVDGETSNGTITDIDGLYTLQTAKRTGILKLKYVGYKDAEIRLSESNNFYATTMEEQINQLEETVVIGYGTQRKISNIGAQSTLKLEDIKTPSASLSTVLAGRLAGVIAVQRTGEPGKDAADIWIRGISTPNTSTPLVLVDGVERAFNDIDPEDIESFTILKDASATAVYGVRGANGVIIIKTKPGKAGKPSISADYYESFTQFTQKVNMADGVSYMKAANEALLNDGLTPKYSPEYIENTRIGKDPYLYPDVNWLKECFNRWGHNRRVNVNIRGGSEKATYYASVSYYNERGMTAVDKSIDSYNSKLEYSRYNFTTNISINATRTTKVDIGAQGYLGEGNYPAISSSDIYGSAMSISPVDYPKMFYINGVAYVPGINPNGGFRNPYADATRRGYDNLTKNQIYSNLRVTQDLGMITKGLTFSAMYAYDVYNEVHLHQSRRESTYYFKNTNVPYDINGYPILTKTYTGSDVLDYSQSSSGNKKTYLEASLTYDRSFGKNRIGGLFLFNREQKLLYPQSTLEESIPYRMMGIAGRATYSWDDKYFAEFNIGYNGAENFSPKHRYGTFPAFGVGWVVSSEKFWKPLSNIVSFLKIRYTDGRIGNSNVSDRRFMYLDQISANGDYGYILGPNGTKYGGYETINNAVDLRWEEAHKQDLGIDLKMFNDDLSIVFDLFKEHRTNILLKRENSIPSFIGYNTASPYGNIGVIDNKGFDGTIEYNKRLNKDWLISVRGNITFNNDKWIKGDLPSQKYPWMEQKGRNILAKTGYIATGLFTQAQIDDMTRWESLSESDRAITPKPFATQFGEVKAGDIQYKDLNNDGKIDAYDKAYICRGDVPQFVYGFGFSLQWKELSIGMMFQGVQNAERLLSGSSIQPFCGGGGSGNLYGNISDRWTETNPNQNAFYPRLSYGGETADNQNNFQPSTWWRRDVSFLRLKTMQISYNLPKSWSNKFMLKNIAIYTMGNNLLTFSKFKLWDPELDTDNGSAYPNTTSYSMGINVTF